MHRSAAILTLVLLTLSLVLGSAAVSAKPNTRNNENAKKCQGDGYLSWARTSDASTAFTSEKECTSFAAMGGKLVFSPVYLKVTLRPFNGIACPVEIRAVNNPEDQFINYVYFDSRDNIIGEDLGGSRIATIALPPLIEGVPYSLVRIEASLYFGGPAIPVSAPPFPISCSV